MATPSQSDIVNAVAASLEKKDMNKQAISVLVKSTEKVLKRIKQNIDEQIKEDSSPIVEEFVKNVASKLANTSQQWIDTTKNDMLVLPEGTKYVFRDGESCTIVVEQAPQLRHLNIGNRGSSNSPTYMLAMPFIQFVISFHGQNVVPKLHVTCTKKSITDLDTPCCHLPLLNIESHSVCFGSNWPKNGNMTEKVNAVISEFWQGQFNFNHIGHFCNFCAENNLGMKVNESSYDAALARWEEKSKQDALWMVAPTTKFKVGNNLRSFFLRDNSTANGSAALTTKLKQEIITAVGTIGGDIQSLLTNIDLVTENREKVHMENMQEILKEIIVQSYSELWNFVEKQLENDRKKLQEEMQIAAQKLKRDFEAYMKDRKTKTTW